MVTAIFYDSACSQALSSSESVETALFKALGVQQLFPYADFICQGRVKNPLCLTPLAMDIGHNYVNLLGAGAELQLSEDDWQSIQSILTPVLKDHQITIEQQQASGFILQSAIENNAPIWQALQSSTFMDCMPTGVHKAFWQRLQTECQMALSQAKFNIARVNQGKMAINARILPSFIGALPFVASD